MELFIFNASRETLPSSLVKLSLELVYTQAHQLDNLLRYLCKSPLEELYLNVTRGITAIDWVGSLLQPFQQSLRRLHIVHELPTSAPGLPFFDPFPHLKHITLDLDYLNYGGEGPDDYELVLNLLAFAAPHLEEFHLFLKGSHQHHYDSQQTPFLQGIYSRLSHASNLRALSLLSPALSALSFDRASDPTFLAKTARWMFEALQQLHVVYIDYEVLLRLLQQSSPLSTSVTTAYSFVPLDSLVDTCVALLTRMPRLENVTVVWWNDESFKLAEQSASEHACADMLASVRKEVAKRLTMAGGRRRTIKLDLLAESAGFGQRIDVRKVILESYQAKQEFAWGKK